ncbi:hypothetical protein BH23BAC1_BH23BAC1_13170 [soil metagenome]
MKLLKNIYFSIGAMVVLIMVSSCSESLEPKPQTYSQLLTGTESKTWRLTTIELVEGDSPPYTFNLPACISDDLYTFYAGSSKLYQVTEGATKCDPDDEDIVVEDTWALVNANATLNFIFPLLANVRLPFIVKRLTETNLVIEIYFDEDDEGNSSSYRMTFTSPRT